MERTDRPPVATFFAAGDWGAEVELGEAAAHHAGVKRLQPGDAVRLSSGDGRRAAGTVSELGKRRLAVAIDPASLATVPRLPHVELWAPVSDRERMLMLAEKAVELGASAWRPVAYRRSRSVSPRGEGDAFRQKVRVRMIGALEQCGAAWLPALHPETTLEGALLTADGVSGIVLDASSHALVVSRESLRAPVAIALGPEGGFESDELAAFLAAGWRAASIGANVLRFETAGIAALAIVRSLIA